MTNVSSFSTKGNDFAIPSVEIDLEIEMDNNQGAYVYEHVTWHLTADDLFDLYEELSERGKNKFLSRLI